MPRLLVAVSSVLMMSGLYGIERLEASPQSPMIPSENGKHFERAVLQDLWPALGYGQIVGRIYYTAVCRPNESIAASFPRLDLRPPPDGKVGVAAVRDIFQHVKGVSVTEREPGIIRIRIGFVPDDLLRVKISYLVLTPEEQYNYWLAIFKIQAAQEVRSAMQKLEIGPRLTINIIPVQQPIAGLTHLPAVMGSVTVDQALDSVAKTFRGVVLYQFCTSGAQYDISFASAAYIYSTLD